MSEPTLTVSLSRESLSLGPLAFSARLDGTALGIVRYLPPPHVARNTDMPDNPYFDGVETVASSWQQTLMGLDWVPVGASSESVVQAAYLEVLAAIGQFSYLVTTQVSGAPSQVWHAKRGSMQLGGSDGRTYVDLKYRVPVYAVTIPVHPIPGSV